MMDAGDRIYLRRRIVNGLALVLSGLASLFGLFWLVWILWVTLSKGLGYLNVSLFTQMTPAAGENGGMLNAFAGSLIIEDDGCREVQRLDSEEQGMDEYGAAPQNRNTQNGILLIESRQSFGS